MTIQMGYMNLLNVLRAQAKKFFKLLHLNEPRFVQVPYGHRPYGDFCKELAQIGSRPQAASLGVELPNRHKSRFIRTPSRGSDKFCIFAEGNTKFDQRRQLGVRRVAYMRSGTCRMLKFSTNAYVPFLIYAVMLSLRLFNDELKSKHRSSIYFFCALAKINLKN